MSTRDDAPVEETTPRYHRALTKAGAPVELWLARGTVHSFLNLRASASRREAGLERLAAYLAAHLGDAR